MIIFDIETAPFPLEEIQQRMPPFNPDKVKLGNATKKETVEKKIEEAREAYWPKIQDKAALDARTGRILAIGMMEGTGRSILHGDFGQESICLTSFWSSFTSCRDNGHSMIGFNIFDFDLPFLVRRSFLLGVEVPWGVIKRRYFNAEVFVDLLDSWRCGQRSTDDVAVTGGLDNLCRTFGIKTYSGEVTGKDFHKFWESDNEKAREYLFADLRMTHELALKMVRPETCS